MHQILQTQFTEEVQEPLIKNLQHTILPYIKKDPYLKDKVVAFEQEKAYILRFIRERNEYLTNRLHDY
jgi:spore coat protein H